MAMTKAEKARVEELETLGAFRWPTEVEPSPMTREEIEAAKVEVLPADRSYSSRHRRVALGWFQNSYNGRVEKGWSDGIGHGRGNWTGDHGAQQMGRMYRTEADALVAMRWEMCRDMAKKLRKVDQQLETARQPEQEAAE